MTQRIRFNVVLEVAHHAAAQDDDVDKVISYDTITEAIERELAAERVNLLETLAERVAARCLVDPRAVRVFVRIEKLDRIPGALGVEIVRSAAARRAPRLRPVDPSEARGAVRPRVVYLAPPRPAARRLGTGARRSPDGAIRWCVCVAPLVPQPAATSEAQRRIGLLAIEQAAWAFCDGDPRFGVAASRTELDWALKTGRLSVWAPAHMAAARRGRPAPDACDPVGARRLAGARDRGRDAGRRRRSRAAGAPPGAGAPRRPSAGLAALAQEGPDDRRLAAVRQLRLARRRLPPGRHRGPRLGAAPRCAGPRACC